ncbi:hypothetical protein B0H16DRAFT_1449616 [Mycena metata]|uniref:Uncharacterized protein n=1 Tax=Mycena metata TaxID=1033252 RepID=A0AAD7NV69_9AGAR|nr:hypothetical protein B0H16DRAFT_1449616 [Mycena metata]
MTNFTNLVILGQLMSPPLAMRAPLDLEETFFALFSVVELYDAVDWLRLNLRDVFLSVYSKANALVAAQYDTLLAAVLTDQLWAQPVKTTSDSSFEVKMHMAEGYIFTLEDSEVATTPRPKDQIKQSLTTPCWDVFEDFLSLMNKDSRSRYLQVERRKARGILSPGWAASYTPSLTTTGAGNTFSSASTRPSLPGRYKSQGLEFPFGALQLGFLLEPRLLLPGPEARQLEEFTSTRTRPTSCLIPQYFDVVRPRAVDGGLNLIWSVHTNQHCTGPLGTTGSDRERPPTFRLTAVVDFLTPPCAINNRQSLYRRRRSFLGDGRWMSVLDYTLLIRSLESDLLTSVTSKSRVEVHRRILVSKLTITILTYTPLASLNTRHFGSTRRLNRIRCTLTPDIAMPAAIDIDVKMTIIWVTTSSPFLRALYSPFENETRPVGIQVRPRAHRSNSVSGEGLGAFNVVRFVELGAGLKVVAPNDFARLYASGSGISLRALKFNCIELHRELLPVCLVPLAYVPRTSGVPLPTLFQPETQREVQLRDSQTAETGFDWRRIKVRAAD